MTVTTEDNVHSIGVQHFLHGQPHAFVLLVMVHNCNIRQSMIHLIHALICMLIHILINTLIQELAVFADPGLHTAARQEDCISRQKPDSLSQ